MIVEAGESRIHRASQQAGDSGVPLANRKAPILQQWVQCLDVLEIGVLRIGGVFSVSSRAQEDLTLAFEELLISWKKIDCSNVLTLKQVGSWALNSMCGTIFISPFLSSLIPFSDLQQLNLALSTAYLELNPVKFLGRCSYVHRECNVHSGVIPWWVQSHPECSPQLIVSLLLPHWILP